MPSLPVYTPQVRSRALTTPRLGAESFGALAGRANQQLGEQFSRTVQQFGEAYRDYQQRKDAAAAFEAEARMRNDWAEQMSKLSQRQGNNAEGVVDEAANWWRQAQARYEGDLSQNARMMLGKAAARTRMTGMGQLIRHQNNELEKAHDASWAASKTSAISTAAKNPSEEIIAATIAELKDKNQYQAQRKGWGADVLKTANEADITTLHENVIDGMLNHPQGGLQAEAYFAKHKDEIDGTRHDEIGKTIRRAAIDDKADLIAARLDGLPATAALQQIQKIEDPQLRKAAKREWSANFNIKRQIQNEAEREAKRAVWATINAGGKPSAAQMRGLSPSEQNRVRNYFEARASGRVSATTGLVHAKVDNLDTIEFLENKIAAGDIRSRQELEEYAPYVRSTTYMSLLKDIEKQGTVDLKDARRAFAERKGIAQTKILTEHREEWEGFKGFLQDKAEESGRGATDLEANADRWFAEGYDKDSAGWKRWIPFTGRDPTTFGEAQLAGRESFRVRTPDEDVEVSQQALSVTRKLLEGSGVSLPNDKRAVDQFYTEHVQDAKQWLQAHGVAVTGATVGAVTTLSAAGRKVTPANVANVLEQMQDEFKDDDAD